MPNYGNTLPIVHTQYPLLSEYIADLKDLFFLHEQS